MTTVSGPMFEPQEDALTKSIYGKDGGHYNIFSAKREADGIAVLKQIFPDGQADDMNFCLFSTSGVHGTYTTIEDIEYSLKTYGAEPKWTDDEEWPDDWTSPSLTFLIVQPRIVKTTYGNATVSLDDLEYLKELRATSWAAVQKIGRGEVEEVISPDASAPSTEET